MVEVYLKEIIESFLDTKIDWAIADANNTKLQKLGMKERKNLSTKTETSTYKYLEYSAWKSLPSRICVGIGFNPAKCSPNDIDNTNEKIIQKLNTEYDAFVLLNLYPLVAPSKEMFDESDERSTAFFNHCIPQLLDYVIDKTEADILVFWGRTASVDQGVFKRIQKLCENGRLYMTVKKGESIHCHPAFVQIEIKKVSKEHLIDSYSIR